MVVITGCRGQGASLSTLAPGFLRPVQGALGIGTSDHRCRWTTALTHRAGLISPGFVHIGHRRFDCGFGACLMVGKCLSHTLNLF